MVKICDFIFYIENTVCFQPKMHGGCGGINSITEYCSGFYKSIVPFRIIEILVDEMDDIVWNSLENSK